MTKKPMSDRELAAWVFAGVVLLLLFLLALTFIAGDGSHVHHIQQISGSHWNNPQK